MLKLINHSIIVLIISLIIILTSCSIQNNNKYTTPINTEVTKNESENLQQQNSNEDINFSYEDYQKYKHYIANNLKFNEYELIDSTIKSPTLLALGPFDNYFENSCITIDGTPESFHSQDRFLYSNKENKGLMLIDVSYLNKNLGKKIISSGDIKTKSDANYESLNNYNYFTFSVKNILVKVTVFSRDARKDSFFDLISKLVTVTKNFENNLS